MAVDYVGGGGGSFPDVTKAIDNWSQEHPYGAFGTAVVCEVCDWTMTLSDIGENGFSWRHLLAFVPFVPGTVGKLVREVSGRTPILGRKLEYVFGKVASNTHNEKRSLGLLKELEKIGLSDTLENRAYLQDHLTKVLNDPSNIMDPDALPKHLQGGTGQVRESLLSGPDGWLKVHSVWDDDTLITVFFESAK